MHQNFSNMRVGLIPGILMTSFTLLYLNNILKINYGSFAIGGLVLFAGFVFLLSNNSKYITKYSLLLVIYFTSLTSILSLASLYAINPLHSATRAWYSVGLYFALFFIYKKVNSIYIDNKKWRDYFSKSLLFITLIIIAGQVFMPDWRMGVGGIRMTGGTNPNSVSFFAVFIIFISHLNSLIDNKWSKINKLNWILGMLIVLWSMSRGTILGLAVFYAFYFGWYFVKGYLRVLLKGEISKKLIKNSFLIALLISIICFIQRLVSDTSFFRLTVARFTSDDGLSTRELAWEILLSHFYKNPLFGGVGWWNATNVLPNVDGIANSPHSLYMRLLSEVGLVGTVAVLALPIIFVIGLVVKSYSEKYAQNEKIMMITAGFIVGIFVRQITEDAFLVSFFSLGNLIIVYGISMGSVVLSKSKLFSSEIVEQKTSKEKRKKFKKYKIVW